ncbi:MAG TPA: methylated-DNA--[protein]-cysteine S-methyltransferase [Verrucomicrobiae bacterium]|nr:methylated-DNA--[protein]-cysteine S-methyltransferase [Verrucomicrobiae bacterium]
MDHLVRDSVIVPTKLGPFRVHYSIRGISRIEFPSDCSGGLRPPKSVGPSPLFLRNFIRQLQQYAAGKLVRWTVPLDTSAGTDFQQRVWGALTTIPRGETRSYGWVAQQIGKPKAARAVGLACGANPIPVVIPCHRVIAGDGSIGGFGGGLPMKQRLLALEHCERRGH